MAINFPDNPNPTDEFTVGTRSWIWNGTVWQSKSRNIELIIDEALEEAKQYADTHIDSTLDVHGISDTADLAYLTDLEGKQDVVAGVSSTEIGYLDGVTSSIQNQIDSKAASSHSHAISDVTNLSQELSDITGDISDIEGALGAAQQDISDLEGALAGKSDVGHGHVVSDVTGLQLALDDKADEDHTHVLEDITDLTVTATELNLVSGVTSNVQEQINLKANSTHSHAIEDVTGLASELDGKADSIHGHEISEISGLTSALDGKASTTHSHGISDVTGLQSELDGKAATVHSHSISDVTNLSTSLSAKADLAGATFTGFVTLNADPTQALHAATKEYVDNVAAGIVSKPSVYAATTANLDATYNNGTSGVGSTLTANSNGAFPLVDGVQLSTQNGFRGILVKNQTNAAHNGRYNLTTLGDANTPWVLTKCALCDTANEVPGSYIFVTDGTVNGGTGWVLFVNDPATYVVGTDPVFAFQFSGSGTVTAGSNISVSGSQVSVVAAPSFADVTVTASATFDGATISGLTLSQDLDDVSTSSQTSGDVLLWDGTSWVNRYFNAIPAKSAAPTISAGTYSIQGTDAGLIIEINSSTLTDVVIPSSESFPIGTQIAILRTGTGAVTVSVQNAGTQTLNFSPSNELRDRWSMATILKRASATWVLYGDLA